MRIAKVMALYRIAHRIRRNQSLNAMRAADISVPHPKENVLFLSNRTDRLAPPNKFRVEFLSRTCEKLFAPGWWCCGKTRTGSMKIIASGFRRKPARPTRGEFRIPRM